jgi:hypothetical protein
MAAMLERSNQTVTMAYSQNTYQLSLEIQSPDSKKQLAECIALIYKHAIIFLYISWALRSELHQSHFGTHVINVQVTAPGHSRMLASS